MQSVETSSVLAQDIFLCTPDNVDVSGTISELLTEEEPQRW